MASSDEAGPSRKRKHAATDRDSLISSPKKKVAKVKYHQKFLPSLFFLCINSVICSLKNILVASFMCSLNSVTCSLGNTIGG